MSLLRTSFDNQNPFFPPYSEVIKKIKCWISYSLLSKMTCSYFKWIYYQQNEIFNQPYSLIEFIFIWILFLTLQTSYLLFSFSSPWWPPGWFLIEFLFWYALSYACKTRLFARYCILCQQDWFSNNTQIKDIKSMLNR